MSAFRYAILATTVAALALADFQYEQTTRVTGGSLLNMPIVGSRLKEPHANTHYIQGNRMAMSSKDLTTIYDLDKGTVTHINKDKRTYSVMTFEEMRQAMEASLKRLQEANNKNPDVNLNWAVNVQDANEDRDIAGYSAHHYILTVSGEALDQKTGNTAGTRITMDLWNARDFPGSEEIRAFYRRFAERMGADFSSDLNPMVRAQLGKGWAQAAQQMTKMEGFTVMSVTRMSSLMNGQEVMVSADQQQRPNVGEAVKEGARESAVGAATSRLGGLGGLAAGGLSGLGRKKKAQEPPPQQQQASGNMVPATMMEMTTELTNAAYMPIDPAVFSIPAGFKQVESDLKRAR